MSDVAKLTLIEPIRISNNPLDDAKIGDFYWVKFDDDEWDENGKRVKVGEHETLMCVDAIGSNHFGFMIYESHGGSSGCRIHFNEFEQRCRLEPNWREILNKRMEDAQKAIQDKTQQLIREGQKLCLLPDEIKVEQSQEQSQSLFPAKVSGDPKKYKSSLIRLQGRLPDIQKEIQELGENFGVAAKNISLPDMVKLDAVKEALGVVEDRIFTIELYCGILEEVKQIAIGEPAPMDTSIVIRQQMLYMDEETLFDYRDGGMDFKKLEDFDKWVSKPENLNRILPDQRGIVAFRVRRNPKDYGVATTILNAWIHLSWKEANEQTYLLIRNGENVYRIASGVDFSPRLIPKEGEIGKDQFTKIHDNYRWDEEEERRKRVVTEELVTPESVEFDDHVKKMENLIRHYNRIVILIQGLLDRSTVFHPHTRINLRSRQDMERWITLVRDEERGLPSNKVNWEEYRKQLNSSLKKGKWVYIDGSYDEGYKDGEKPYDSSYGRYNQPRRRGWAAFKMPLLCKVDSIKRDGSKVRVSWPWGRLAKSKRKNFIESATRPGWGHYEYDTNTDRMCHEWIPITRIINVSDYHAGDYRMFLCDRALRGEYLKWAQYLLTAEDWARDREKGLPPEQDQKAQARD